MLFIDKWKDNRNILNAYAKVQEALHGSLSDSEAFEWQWNLNGKIEKIKQDIEKCETGQDLETHIYLYKIPKNSGKPRDYYYVPFDFEVLWISFLNIFGPYVDKIMPRYSFGYRLWRPFGKNIETGDWEYGDYSVPSNKIYTSFNRSYKPFRRYQKIFLHNILGVELDRTEIENLNMESKKDNIWISEQLCKGVQDVDVWKKGFPLFCFKNQGDCGVGKDKLYYIKLDIKDFFPSIDRNKLLENASCMLEHTELKVEKESIIKYLESLMNFDVKPLYKVLPEKSETSTDCRNIGIPIGMLSSGFLANIYLFCFDLYMDKMIKDAYDNRRILGYFRYVDDIVIITDDEKGLKNAIKEVEGEFEKLGLKVNKDKLKPDVVAKYYRIRQFSTSKANQVSLPDSVNSILDEISNIKDEEINDNLRLALDVDKDEEVTTEQLYTKFMKEFEIKRENYHDFQTSVFNEMSNLSEEEFDFSSLDELKMDFQRTRNLIRAYLDEGKIEPQTRMSFSAHLILRILRSLFKHHYSYKSAHWVRIEKEMNFQELSESIKKSEDERIRIEIEHLIKDALDDITFVIINTPAKTKLLKRYIELIELLNSHRDNPEGIKIPNVSLKNFLTIVDKTIQVDDSTKPFLYFEFLRYLNEILIEKLRDNQKISKIFLDDVADFIEALTRESENDEQELKIPVNLLDNSLIAAEIIDLITLLKLLGYGLDDVHSKVRSIDIQKYEDFPAIQRKLNTYDIIKSKKQFSKDTDVCFSLLSKLVYVLRSDEFQSIAVKPISSMVKLIIQSKNDYSDEDLRKIGHLLLSIYFATSNEDLRESVVKSSMCIQKHVFESYKESRQGKIKNSEPANYKLNQIVLSAVCEKHFHDSSQFREDVKSMVLVAKDKRLKDPKLKWLSLVMSTASQFLDYSCIDDKRSLKKISLANFLRISHLSYPEKILLIFLVASVRKKPSNYGKNSSDQTLVFTTTVNVEEFYNLFDKIQSGREPLEDVNEEDIKKVIEFRDSELGAILEISDESFYWLILQILEDRNILESLAPEIENIKKYTLRNVWKILVENQLVSTDIANCISDKIGRYAQNQLKPYRSSSRSLEELLTEELTEVLLKRSTLKKVELPPLVYGKQEIKPFVRIGIFQPTVNYFENDYAHIDEKLRYDEFIIDNLVEELEIALKVFKEKGADLIIAPELCIPHKIESQLIRWCSKSRIIAIYGTEYVYNNDKREVRNCYKVVWPYNDLDILVINGYKRFFNLDEEIKFCERNIKIVEGDMTSLYLSNDIGNFSVLVCYDTLHIETLSALKGRVDTVFVPAYNRDVNTFKGVADAMSKIVYCNFVIANTGLYGGSVVRLPYYDVHRREALTLEGNEMFGAQLVDIPIQHLRNFRKITANGQVKKNKQKQFKSLPPEYKYWENS